MSMKPIAIATCLAAHLFLIAASPRSGLAQPAQAGGYAKTSVTDKEVVAAAAFAIKAQQKALQEKKQPDLPRLELLKILHAEQQVVAGLNYRLKLKVTLDGEEKLAETVVWWQAWRKPFPHQLTSWTWK